MCPDRLGDRARVTQAISVHGSDYEQVDSVGEKARDCVRFHLDHVGNSLPCAACRLAAKRWRKTTNVIVTLIGQRD